MNDISLDEITYYVSANITEFHNAKLKRLNEINLKTLITKKNPYLYRAKDILVAGDFVKSVLDAFLTSSEEKQFGDFLEGLVIFIASKTLNGTKSSAKGIDLEYTKDEVHYLVSIKSGPNWGNSSQYATLERNFKNAITILKQSKHTVNVQPVLGMCYGRSKRSFPRNFMKIMGQEFWYEISGNMELYKEIIEPLGFEAKRHNDKIKKVRASLENKLTSELIEKYCDDYQLNWLKIVEFNSKNL